jgi:hypothetical protein
METGTQIILQRMKDCPEEFPNEGEYHGKWGKIIQDARNYLPTQDVEALDAGYKQLQVDRFNERVLKTLAGEEPKKETLIFKSSERYATGFSDPRAFANVAVKGEGQTINDHLDAHRLATGIGISHQQHTNMAKKASR